MRDGIYYDEGILIAAPAGLPPWPSEAPSTQGSPAPSTAGTAGTGGGGGNVPLYIFLYSDSYYLLYPITFVFHQVCSVSLCPSLPQPPALPPPIQPPALPPPPGTRTLPPAPSARQIQHHNTPHRSVSCDPTLHYWQIQREKCDMQFDPLVPFSTLVTEVCCACCAWRPCQPLFAPVCPCQPAYLLCACSALWHCSPVWCPWYCVAACHVVTTPTLARRLTCCWRGPLSR